MISKGLSFESHRKGGAIRPDKRGFRFGSSDHAYRWRSVMLATCEIHLQRRQRHRAIHRGFAKSNNEIALIQR